MSENVIISLSPEYVKHLELLKQVIPDENGEEIKDDSKMVEVLIDSFVAFIQEQATHHAHDHTDGCCGGEGHCHEHEHEHQHQHQHGKEKGECCKK